MRSPALTRAPSPAATPRRPSRRPQRCARLVTLLVASLALAGLVRAQETGLTNGGFEQLLPDGRPLDWEVLGASRVETGEGHSGQRALHLVRRADTPGEVGLNRVWKPGSGNQGTMLAALKGGLRFWYKAAAARPSDALTVQVIPMDNQPLEIGGSRVVWRVPAAHVGDGQWHEGRLAYDLQSVKGARWVHVGARVLGQEGDLWLDDLEWVREVGPVLQIQNLGIQETAGREGEEGTLSAEICNLGDRAAAGVRCSLELPAGLAAAGGPAATQVLPAGAKHALSWRLTGKRSQAGGRLRLRAVQNNEATTAELALAPGVPEPVALRCSQRLIQAGQPLTVDLIVRQGGTTIAAGVHASLTAPEGFAVEPLATGGELRPGVDSVAGSWRVTAARPVPLAWLTARLGDASVGLQAPVTVMARAEVPALPAAAAGAYAAVQETVAVIGTERARLVLVREPWGWADAHLQARVGDAWQDAARLPCLGLLADAAGETPLAGAEARAESADGRARLLLAAEAKAGGSTWAVTWELSVESGSDLIGFRLTAVPATPAAITALEGPMLYGGEGSSAVRRDAIVPGLEWLVEGEESSNSLDFKPDHPDRLRYVPHPYKVTVPAVGMTLGNMLVGLLWDTPAAQPSADLAGALTVVFASPDRFEGHRSHLAGLSLPAVGRGRAENARRAETPLAVPAGQGLTLRADLLATAAGPDGALAVVDRWYARHGVPAILPYPRGEARAEIAFSLGAYAKERALWNPEWGKWRAGLIAGGPRTPTEAPAFELAFGAQLLGETPEAAQARALAAEVWAVPPAELSRRIQHRTDMGALLAKAREARSLIARQHADGTWRFGGEKAGDWPAAGVNYAVLGPVGASEVGLTARAATAVLEYALLSADGEARTAGMKALAAMRQFRVPRAAQVWEVPVHTPDILASAQAVDAYLAGYRLTGDARLLQDAIYWARTGLPFVYVWHPTDQPAMQGATIPVFGGTSYVLSWLAVAVQWNGLAYSDALFDLAEVDSSFPWRQVAESILRSAMYQQASEGERLGQWPDAMNFIAGRRGPHGQTPPCFRPSTVLQQTWRVMGTPATPQVVAVRRGDEVIALRGTAALTDATWQDEGLQFTATYAEPLRGAVEVFAVARPAAVELDGREVAAVADVWAGAESAWTWHETTATLEVRLVTPGKHRLLVRGVRHLQAVWLPPLLRDLNVDFATATLDGWTALHDLAALSLAEGTLRTVTTGTDPYLSREGLFVEGRKGDVLVLRISCSGGAQSGSIFWGTEHEPGSAAQRQVGFELKGDATLEEVRVPVGAHPQWAGQAIISVRIDPGSGAAGVQIRIAAVRLERAAP